MKNPLIGFALFVAAIAATVTIGEMMPANSAPPNSFTSIPWTAMSPKPCPASSPLSIAVASPYIYVVCADTNIYVTQKQ